MNVHESLQKYVDDPNMRLLLIAYNKEEMNLVHIRDDAELKDIDRYMFGFFRQIIEYMASRYVQLLINEYGEKVFDTKTEMQ